MKIDATWKKLLLIFLAVKALVFLWIFVGVQILDVCSACETINLHYLAGSSFGDPLRTWDTQHYLFLAEYWYIPDHLHTAFYPLFPAVIYTFKFLVAGNFLLAGLLVSNIASILALWIFYLLTKKLFNKHVAFHAGIFLMLFPTGFYLHVAYSESLFLLLVLTAFFLSYLGKPILSALTSFFLPITRAQGLLVALPLAYKSYRDNPKKIVRHLLFLLVPAAGFLFYLLIMHLSTGNAFAGFDAQSRFISQNSIGNLFNPIGWIKRNFFDVTWTIHGVGFGLMDRLFFLGFIWALFETFTSLDRNLFLYVLILGGVSALSGNLLGFPRYMLVLFPIFIVMALRIKRPRTRVLTWILFGSLQLVLIFFHTHFFWVS